MQPNPNWNKPIISNKMGKAFTYFGLFIRVLLQNMLAFPNHNWAIDPMKGILAVEKTHRSTVKRCERQRDSRCLSSSEGQNIVHSHVAHLFIGIQLTSSLSFYLEISVISSNTYQNRADEYIGEWRKTFWTNLR